LFIGSFEGITRIGAACGVLKKGRVVTNPDDGDGDDGGHSYHPSDSDPCERLLSLVNIHYNIFIVP